MDVFPKFPPSVIAIVGFVITILNFLFGNGIVFRLFDYYRNKAQAIPKDAANDPSTSVLAVRESLGWRLTESILLGAFVFLTGMGVLSSVNMCREIFSKKQVSEASQTLVASNDVANRVEQPTPNSLLADELTEEQKNVLRLTVFFGQRYGTGQHFGCCLYKDLSTVDGRIVSNTECLVFRLYDKAGYYRSDNRNTLSVSLDDLVRRGLFKEDDDTFLLNDVFREKPKSYHLTSKGEDVFGEITASERQDFSILLTNRSFQPNQFVSAATSCVLSKNGIIKGAMVSMALSYGTEEAGERPKNVSNGSPLEEEITINKRNSEESENLYGE